MDEIKIWSVHSNVLQNHWAVLGVDLHLSELVCKQVITHAQIIAPVPCRTMTTRVQHASLVRSYLIKDTFRSQLHRWKYSVESGAYCSNKVWWKLLRLTIDLTVDLQLIISSVIDRISTVLTGQWSMDQRHRLRKGGENHQHTTLFPAVSPSFVMKDIGLRVHKLLLVVKDVQIGLCKLLGDILSFVCDI